MFESRLLFDPRDHIFASEECGHGHSTRGARKRMVDHFREGLQCQRVPWSDPVDIGSPSRSSKSATQNWGSS